MLEELLDLVLFTTIGVFVSQAIIGITANFAKLLALLGLMETRHNSTSFKRAGLPYVLVMFCSFLWG